MITGSPHPDVECLIVVIDDTAARVGDVTAVFNDQGATSSEPNAGANGDQSNDPVGGKRCGQRKKDALDLAGDLNGNPAKSQRNRDSHERGDNWPAKFASALGSEVQR